MYLIDTNIFILFGKRTYAELTIRMQNAIDLKQELSISTIVLQEIEVGILRDRNPDGRRAKTQFLLRHIENIFPYDVDDALFAAAIKADMLNKGESVGAYDLLLAAQAMRRDLILVSHDQKAFPRIPGLRWEDWTQP